MWKCICPVDYFDRSLNVTFTTSPLSVLCEMSLAELLKMLGLGAVAVALGLEGLDWLLTRRLWPRRVSRQPLKEVLFFPSPPACVEHLYNPGSRHPWWLFNYIVLQLKEPICGSVCAACSFPLLLKVLFLSFFFLFFINFLWPTVCVPSLMAWTHPSPDSWSTFSQCVCRWTFVCSTSPMLSWAGPCCCYTARVYGCECS